MLSTYNPTDNFINWYCSSFKRWIYVEAEAKITWEQFTLFSMGIWRQLHLRQLCFWRFFVSLIHHCHQERSILECRWLQIYDRDQPICVIKCNKKFYIYTNRHLLHLYSNKTATRCVSIISIFGRKSPLKIQKCYMQNVKWCKYFKTMQ